MSNHNVYSRSLFSGASVLESDRQVTKGIDVVYYVKHLRHVKIGTTAEIFKRISHLGCAPSDVLAIEFGSFDLERQRHEQFAHLLEPTLGREHFRLGPDLKQHIISLRSAA